MTREEAKREMLFAKRNVMADSWIDKAYDMAIEALTSAEETAEWVWDEDAIDWGIGAWVCSKCKNRPQTYWEKSKEFYPLKWVGSQYCGCCGAKMQKGEAR